VPEACECQFKTHTQATLSARWQISGETCNDDCQVVSGYLSRLSRGIYRIILSDYRRLIASVKKLWSFLHVLYFHSYAHMSLTQQEKYLF